MSIGSQRQMLQSSCSDLYARVLKKEDDDESFNATSSKSSIEDLTVANNGSSSSSSDMADEDDASSSSTSWSSSSRSMASSYDLSELMSQLPIKRELSKFYQGKSQSFSSLSRVTSIQDLPKKQSPISHRLKKRKESKSYAGGLNSYKLHTLPNPIISKKSPLSSSSFPVRRGSFVSTNSCR